MEYETNSAESFYYHRAFGFLSRSRVAQIVKKLGDVKDGLILDAGCEAGYLSIKLADSGFNSVGFDLCRQAVHDFNTKLESKPVDKITPPLVADAYAIPFKKSTFDAIVCSEVIPILPSLKKMFKEFSRVLKKDGVLVLSFGNQRNRRMLFPLLRNAGMNVDAIDKTFPYHHSLEDIRLCMGEDFTVAEVDFFPLRIFTLNTLVVLKKPGNQIKR